MNSKNIKKETYRNREHVPIELAESEIDHNFFNFNVILTVKKSETAPCNIVNQLQ